MSTDTTLNMTDPLNDPLRIWHRSLADPLENPVKRMNKAVVVIESTVYAKRVAAEFMLDIAAGKSFSGVSFQTTPQSFVIKWESPIPVQTKNNIAQVFHRLENLFNSYQASTYKHMFKNLVFQA